MMTPATLIYGISMLLAGAGWATGVCWVIARRMWVQREQGYRTQLVGKDAAIAVLRHHITTPAAGPSSDGGAADLNRGGRGIITSACPSCGCMDADTGHIKAIRIDELRVCAHCGQEWWIDVEYPNAVSKRWKGGA